MPESVTQALEALVAKLQGWFESAVTMAPNFVLALLFVALAGVIARYAGRGARRGLARVVDNDGLVSLVSSLVRVAVIGVGLTAALTILHLERTVSSLLAGLGVVGLALGFAFKDIAANFMSGVFLAVRGPFEAGDLVEVDGRVGHVENIELRRTMLRTLDGLTIIIPNKEMFQQTLINYTHTKDRRVDVNVGVAYGDDLEHTREVVCAALDGLECRDPSRDVEVIFMQFGASSIDFEVRFWIVDSDQLSYLRARSEAIVRIKQAMDAADLTIPFPIRTLDFGAEAVGGERLDQMRLESLRPTG